MKLDPGIHIVMHSVLSLKPGVTKLHANPILTLPESRLTSVPSTLNSIESPYVSLAHQYFPKVPYRIERDEDTTWVDLYSDIYVLRRILF